MEQDRGLQKIFRTLFSVFCIAAGKEVCFWLLPDDRILNTVIKLLTGAAVLFVSYGNQKRPSSAEEKTIVSAVILYILADLVMRWHFVLSGALFLIGHLFLIFCFCRKKTPGRRGIAVWAVLTVIEAPFLIHLFMKNGLSLVTGITGALYASVLCFLAVCAFDQGKLLTAAVILFVCSDLCLARFKLSPDMRWIHTPSILLFYLSIALFLIYCRDDLRKNAGMEHYAGTVTQADREI